MTQILFVCVENSCRSQMAEGFAKKLGEGKIEAFSAGSNPSGQVEKMAIKVMQERGIDISDQKSKGFGDIEARISHLNLGSGIEMRYYLAYGKDLGDFLSS